MTADRGKAAEAAVKKVLKSMESAGCVHHRFPDLRGGSMVTAPCDFMVLKNGKLTLLEVKSVGHLHRLPHKNFSPDQRARMRMWGMAGANAYVLVHFAPTKLWRYESAEWFMQMEGGSWDMSGLPLEKLDVILGGIL